MILAKPPKKSSLISLRLKQKIILYLTFRQGAWVLEVCGSILFYIERALVGALRTLEALPPISNFPESHEALGAQSLYFYVSEGPCSFLIGEHPARTIIFFGSFFFGSRRQKL